MAEWPDEVETLLDRLGFKPAIGEVQYVYNVLYAMKPMILEWLTMIGEVTYAPEFAYHIDYFIRNKVKYMVEPEVKIFAPSNYPNDYKISDDEGVAKIISDIVSFS